MRRRFEDINILQSGCKFDMFTPDMINYDAPWNNVNPSINTIIPPLINRIEVDYGPVNDKIKSYINQPGQFAQIYVYGPASDSSQLTLAQLTSSGWVLPLNDVTYTQVIPSKLLIRKIDGGGINDYESILYKIDGTEYRMTEGVDKIFKKFFHLDRVIIRFSDITLPSGINLQDYNIFPKLKITFYKD